jgi:hypothetical protein
MFEVSAASLQTFIDTPNCVLEDRVQHSTVHITNVSCAGHLQIIGFVGIVLYCNRQVHRDFMITLYKRSTTYAISKLCNFGPGQLKKKKNK